MLAEAKEVLHRAVPRDFTEIQKPSDLMALSIDSGTFHDGYILGMHEEAGILEILLDTSWKIH